LVSYAVDLYSKTPLIKNSRSYR